MGGGGGSGEGGLHFPRTSFLKNLSHLSLISNPVGYPNFVLHSVRFTVIAINFILVGYANLISDEYKAIYSQPLACNFHNYTPLTQI